MKVKLLLSLLLGLCLGIAAVIIGCGSSGDGSGSAGITSSGRTATIRGNISSFDTAKADFVPVERQKRTFFAKLASGISDVLISSADARGLLEGIIVYIEGPASHNATVGEDGTFVFSGIPAGAYQLRFEYQGEQVRYRGRSG